MKPDSDNLVLTITNGYNGDVTVYEDFFKYSHAAQEIMIADIIMPMLYEFKSIHVNIGYRNT